MDGSDDGEQIAPGDGGDREEAPDIFAENTGVEAKSEEGSSSLTSSTTEASTGPAQASIIEEAPAEEIASKRKTVAETAGSPPQLEKDDEHPHFSLERRRQFANNNVLLMPGSHALSSREMRRVSLLVEDDTSRKATKRGLLRMTCLNPRFTLRTQLMLSFGSVNFFTIAVVIVICVAVSLLAGQNIKETNQQTFEGLAEHVRGRTARYLAESLEHRLIPKDEVQIMYEVIRDRFQGFPGDVNDTLIPFRDMDTNTSVYPIVGTPIPLDWQIEDNVSDDSKKEHLQGRRNWYGMNEPLSTANGFFVMQGACDPSVTDPTAKTYWKNCTDANNDISTGGIIAPSNLTEHIHRKASDLVPTMKALYEYNQHIREIGVYFSNQGVGATISFPHYELDTNNTYVSIGCEWMKEPNPYDSSRPIATQQEIDRCYKKDTVLSSREFSPLGRAWCRDQALHPEEILIDGPFLDAWIKSNWLLSLGRGVYDRITNDFIACIFVGLSTDFVEEIMRASRVTPNSEVSVVRWNSVGSVLGSSAWNTSQSGQVVTIDQLNLGMTNETYREFYSLIDYSSVWDPVEVQDVYESFAARADGFFVAAYPIPPIPDEFDPSYRPVFFALVSTDEGDVFGTVDEVNDNVDERVDRAILFSVVAGAAGFVLTMIIILVTSTAITRPLQLMNKEADQIVGNFGDDSLNAKEIHPVNLSLFRCVPNTEITDVVKEFNKMVSTFSGSLMARSESGKFVESRNWFDLRVDFRTLYKSREQSDLSDRNTVVNAGSNLKSTKQPSQRFDSSITMSGKRAGSPLFMWTVILIVTPLLLTTITIAAVVISSVSREFDESVNDAELHFVDVEISSLAVYVQLRADFVATSTSRSVRDLYIMTRYGGWLLFDGVEKSGSFSETVTAVNECLEARSSETCPYAIENRVCDCAWEYEDQECQTFPEGSRELQVPYFFVQSDAALPNGTRWQSDFPKNSVSPNTTLWWDDPYDLPNANESTTEYSTTYARLRGISAFPLFPVLNNYDIKKENGVGHFFAFGDDGLVVANEGCSNSEHSYAAFWKSTKENGAAQLRPELCPLGKYGFDPRCREWYDTGRRRALDNESPLYVTAPYLFAKHTSIAQSATSPLIDPRTGYYVGQVLIDFSVNQIIRALTSSGTPLSTGGFPLMITVESDAFGGDTVIGPGLNGSVTAQPVSKVVMPLDQDCPPNAKMECIVHYQEFEKVIEAMKAGNTSSVSFERTTAEGGAETVYMSFAPVTVKYLQTADASDFSRGALASKHIIYSLGLAETEGGIVEPFVEVKDDMRRQVHVAIGILAAVIVVAVVLTICMSYVFARSISEPMYRLVGLIRSLNQRDVGQDPPSLDKTTGSKEIVNVSNTMDSLYRVVRLANLSFYAGDLEAAYRVLVDALRLFKRLANKKAIGVASNNLGNTMQAIYREIKNENLEFNFGLTPKEIIVKGTAYFHEAIQLGEKAYDEFYEREGWSPNCLDFMQHLSNRYFNRGIFLLTIKDDHEHPQEIEELGFRDLGIARDMDAEIVALGEESGWGRVNRAEKLFNMQLGRVRGQLMLLELGYSDEWEIDENLDHLFKLLEAESTKGHSELFDEVNYIGRLQQAETEMARYLMIKKEIVPAAKIAIRMLFEDEFVFADANVQAINVLQAYVDSSANGFDPATSRGLNESLQDLLDGLKDDFVMERKRAMYLSRDHNITSRSLRSTENSFEPLSSSCNWSVANRSDRFVTMEQF